MTILWAIPAAIATDGTLAHAGAAVRITIDLPDAHIGSSGHVPISYYGLGVLGWRNGSYYYPPMTLRWRNHILESPPADADGIYWQLGSGITASLELGFGMSVETRPSGLVAISTTHNLVNGTATTITWQAVEAGTGQLPDLADLRRMVLPVAGLWLCTLVIGLPAATYTDVHARLLLTGAAYRTLGREPIGVIGANGLIRAYSAVAPFAAGAAVTINLQQSSGADRLLDTHTRWQMSYVAAL